MLIYTCVHTQRIRDPSRLEGIVKSNHQPTLPNPPLHRGPVAKNDTSIYIYTCVYTYRYIHIYIYICRGIYIYMYVDTCTYRYAYMQSYKNYYMHTHADTHLPLSVCVCTKHGGGPGLLRWGGGNLAATSP